MFKNLLQSQLAKINQILYKLALSKGSSFVQVKGQVFFKREIITKM
jgi:hypothetical protein